MQKVVFPLIPAGWQPELEYWMQEEFTSKIQVDGKIKKVSSEDINRQYNAEQYNPVDGEIIRGCDHLSAYLEAYLSLKFGVQSEQIQAGYHNLSARYENKEIAGVDFGQLFDYFRL